MCPEVLETYLSTASRAHAAATSRAGPENWRLAQALKAPNGSAWQSLKSLQGTHGKLIVLVGKFSNSTTAVLPDCNAIEFETIIFARCLPSIAFWVRKTVLWTNRRAQSCAGCLSVASFWPGQSEDWKVHLALLSSPKTRLSFQHVRLNSTKQKGSTFSFNGELSLPEPEQGFDSWQTKALQYVWGWIASFKYPCDQFRYTSNQRYQSKSSLTLWLCRQSRSQEMDASDSPKPSYLWASTSYLYTSNTSMLMQPTFWTKWAFSTNRATATRAHAAATLRCPGDHPSIGDNWSPSQTLPFCVLLPLAIWKNEQSSGFPLQQTMLGRLNHLSSRSFRFYISVSCLFAFFWCVVFGLRATFKHRRNDIQYPASGDLDLWPCIRILLHIAMLRAVASATICNNGVLLSGFICIQSQVFYKLPCLLQPKSNICVLRTCTRGTHTRN